MHGIRTAALLAALLGGAAGGAAAQGRETARGPVLRFAGAAVTLAMPLKGGRHLVAVTIGSEGPFDFIIDTGSDVTVLDTRVAARLGLASTGTVRLGAPGGGAVEAGIVRIPVLRVGDLEVSGVTARTMALGDLSGGLMQGILGMDLFREVLLTLDPAGDRATVSRERLAPGAPGVLRLHADRAHLGVEIDVAGRPFTAHLDTGAPGTFTLPLAAMDELPMTGPERRSSATLVGSTREIRGRQLDGAIRFGGLTFERPWIEFLSPSLPVANIGAQILDRLVMRLDQAGGLVGFAPSTAPTPPAAAGSPRRLGLRLGGPGGSLEAVAAVDPGSPADQAGLRAGDVIRVLNGRPMSDYEPAALGTLFRGSEPLRFEVERDGRRLVVAIP